MKTKILLITLTIGVVLLGACVSPPAPAPPLTPQGTPAPVPPTVARETLIPPTSTAVPVVTPVTTPTSTPTTTPTPPPDTTPPPTIIGLVANNAYEGRVNLWWDRSTAADFDHYNVYLSRAEITDITGVKAIQQIKDIAKCNLQVSGLDNKARYYFAVTAVDRSGNENKRVASTSATFELMPRGSKDTDIVVDIYESEMTWSGTTLLPDNHNPQKPRIIEVNMLGEIVWQYVLPDNLSRYTNPGFDVELLPNGNILYVLPGNGVYEMDRGGKIVWSYLTTKISHDADRLPNGNTLFAFGYKDQKSDAQVTEISPKGEVVWAWYAKTYFDKPPYNSVFDGGWTHTNAVSRLPNSNTLVSLRNFNLVAEVDPKGEVVRTYGEGIFVNQHDPEVLSNGNILLANHGRPHRAIEFDPKTGRIVWQSQGFELTVVPVRDANRLPNGNTLITGTTEIVEVTPQREIVWRLRLQGVSFTQQDAADLGFYKANRISQPK